MRKIFTAIVSLSLCSSLICSCENIQNNDEFNTLTIDRDYVSLSSEGGEFIINIESNTDWVIVSEANWCVASVSSGHGDAMVRFVAENNESYENRTAFIFIEYDGVAVDIQVEQDAFVLEDVVSEMDDSTFAKYCISNFDLDSDGCISPSEANKVKTIVLKNMPDLKSVKGIEYFKNLEDIKFYNSGIKEIDLTQNKAIIRLEEDDFERCHSLESVHFSENVRYFEDYVISNNDNIKYIYFHGTTPPEFEWYSDFTGSKYYHYCRMDSRPIIYVPVGCVNAYQKALSDCGYWDDYIKEYNY